MRYLWMRLSFGLPAILRFISYSTALPVSDSEGNEVAVFFASPDYAVVGASDNEDKYGTKVFKFLLENQMNAFPINPFVNTSQGHPCLPSLYELPHPETTSVSIVTQPSVTLGIIKQAVELGIPAIWIQPGAADGVVIEFIKRVRRTENAPTFIFPPTRDHPNAVAPPPDLETSPPCNGEDIISVLQQR